MLTRAVCMCMRVRGSLSQIDVRDGDDSDVYLQSTLQPCMPSRARTESVAGTTPGEEVRERMLLALAKAGEGVVWTPE